MAKGRIFPPFWLKYLDDVLALAKRQDATSVLSSLNNIHKKITLTMEIVVVRSLSSLDVKIINGDWKVEFDIF